MKNELDIKKIDKNNFINMLKSLPLQIKEIINNEDVINNYTVTMLDFKNILICGMGGSAIGGDMAKSLIEDDICIPIYINRDYHVPKWVDSHTLVILSSYSGNTEETLSCYEECTSRNSFNIIMTSGGELLRLGIKKRIPYALIPAGYMPRAALGYSVSIILRILHSYGIIDEKPINALSECIVPLKQQSDEYSIIDCSKNKAINLASKIFNKFNIIYTSKKMEVLSLRFRAQLAENSKILSTHFIFPEQNHNEIEGFQNLYINNINIIWIDDIDNHKKISKRMDATKKLLANINHIDISFEDTCYFKRQMQLIYFLDWVSFYCAIYNNTNPYSIDLISELKDML